MGVCYVCSVKTNHVSKTRSRQPEQHWTPTRLAINLLLTKPALALATGTHDELADSNIPGVDLLLKILDRIHDEPGITTQNLLDRFKEDTSRGPSLQARSNATSDRK